MENKLFILSGCEAGEILDAFVFTSFDQASARMKKLFEEILKCGGYAEEDTYIDESSFG